MSYKLRRKLVQEISKLYALLPLARKHAMQSDVYGTIYLPKYEPYAELDSEEHEIYNCDGQLLRSFFIRDMLGTHCCQNRSKYIFWDRYNFGLKTHFYTHGSMCETMGKPDYKYGWLLESEAIQDYDIFKKYPGLHEDFDLIFTHSAKILDSIPNARFMPANGCWYGFERGSDVILSEDAWQRKTKNVSIICSNKEAFGIQHQRKEIAKACKRTGLADCFGSFDGGTYLKFKSDSLVDYRYQIVVENDIKPYYFTEKILDCFASMTIPIYYGATEIGNYFDQDGIIVLRSLAVEDLKLALQRCTPQVYAERLNSVKKNYFNVLKYADSSEYLYRTYFATGN